MASAAAAAPWTSALAALPPRLRLEWQRTISADVNTQLSDPKQGPLSRAYASGGPDGDTLPGLIAGSAFGRHVTAASRKIKSTADLLSGMLVSAIGEVGVTPDIPFPQPVRGEGHDEAPAGLSSSSNSSSINSSSLEELFEAEKASVSRAITAAGLDAAYQPVVLKSLQRRLKDDAEWAEEAATSSTSDRFPGVSSIADGSAKAAAEENLVRVHRARLAPPGASSGSSDASDEGSWRSPATSEVDDLLDSALDDIM